MPSVLYISKGSDSASTRYRALDYFPLLQQAGWQCRHITSTRSVFNYINILRAAARADVVVVLRKTFSHWFISQLRKRARRLVFDFDDAIFARSNGKHSVKRAKGFKRMLQRADAVWAGNRYLAEKAGEFNRHIHLVPTSIDLSRYNMDVAKSAEHIDIVWIGSSSTRKYLHMALPALTQACAHNKRLRLKIIADFDIYDTGIPTVAIPWSVESEARELANAHIGIAPMSDNVWTRGKCALKVLQYMAAGLPVISSNAGANAEVIEDGKTGLLVNSHEAWVAAINELANDKGKREAFGKAGRARCEQHYSQQAVFAVISKTLNELVKKN